MSVFHTTRGGRGGEGGWGGVDLVIFENLDKSLEDVCNGIPTRKNKVHVSCALQKRTYPRNLFPAFSFTVG